MQIDTTNVLFICGGAFAGIEKIVENRIGAKGVGFGADIRRPEDKDLGAIFSDVKPEDLAKFGLIPEFIGRMPVVGAVNHLEPDALVEILTEPRNALVKQYRKIFEFENVELEFMPEALGRDRRRGNQAKHRRPGPAVDPRGNPPGDDVRHPWPRRRHQGCRHAECVVDDDVAPEVVTLGSDRRAS